MLKAKSLSSLPGIRHAFFSRAGGVSTGVYEGLNGGTGSSDTCARGFTTVFARGKSGLCALAISSAAPNASATPGANLAIFI